SSMCGVTAVDGERVPYHEACTGARKPQDGGGNLLRAAKSTDGLFFRDLFHGFGFLAIISATIGVSIAPGHTALMRIPREAYSRAALFVSPITPCLVA